MSLVDVVEAAAAVLDAVDERIGAADGEWVAYDHAGAEAVVFVAGCLEVAGSHPIVALRCLQHALRLIQRLPLPTPRFEFQDRVKSELHALGLPFEVAARLRLVA